MDKVRKNHNFHIVIADSISALVIVLKLFTIEQEIAQYLLLQIIINYCIFRGSKDVK